MLAGGGEQHSPHHPPARQPRLPGPSMDTGRPDPAIFCDKWQNSSNEEFYSSEMAICQRALVGICVTKQRVHIQERSLSCAKSQRWLFRDHSHTHHYLPPHTAQPGNTPARSRDHPLLRAIRNINTAWAYYTSWANSEAFEKMLKCSYQHSVMPWVHQLRTEEIKLTFCILIYDIKMTGSLLIGLEK